MPEHPGFELRQINGRSIVRLRVRPNAADDTSKALKLPQALQWRDTDPAACWLGPDQWLLTSDSKSAGDIIRHLDGKLEGQLHAATDMSSGNACFAMKGQAIRTILAMGCGIDLHPDKFKTGDCARTNFAQVPLFIVAVEDKHFDLYVDRSYARYLEEWISRAGEDPIPHEPDYYPPEPNKKHGKPAS